MFVQRHILKEK